MNILYVYAHPNSESLNASLMQHGVATLQGHGANVLITDLYAQHFKAAADRHDFNLPDEDMHQQYFIAQHEAHQQHTLSADISAELEKITWADHIIFQFPLWWFAMPSIMKGWLDRVLVKGFAYDTGKIFDKGLLQGKSASLAVTTQSPETAYQVNGMHGANIDSFLLPIHHTLRFAGMKTMEPFVSYGAFNLDTDQQVKVLRDYSKYLVNLIISRQD